MANVSLLEFRYKISKKKFLRKPSRLFSSQDRQNSGLLPTFMPNINEMKKVFDKFDSNKDGKISQSEYKVILTALGQENMIAEVPKIFQAIDQDKDGYIDFKEFTEIHKGGGVRTMDIQSAFRAFDMNHDGQISAEEIMEILRRLGESCSLEDCRQMVRAVDTDGDGMVNMDEFMTMMTRTTNDG
ncbi:calmodulin-like protein 1 [Pistacia vera]|uniref:calmodulin-like protein 1 n=1 Tax=Pistacia vera TaxID=55513 RepID=UPI0012631EC9|nr:calmodulin-like protein 1 [Pistacia vera]